jgi:hypothetical protein
MLLVLYQRKAHSWSPCIYPLQAYAAEERFKSDNSALLLTAQRCTSNLETLQVVIRHVLLCARIFDTPCFSSGFERSCGLRFGLTSSAASSCWPRACCRLGSGPLSQLLALA